MKHLVYKSQDSQTHVVADTSTARVTFVLPDSTPLSIEVTGSAGASTVVFSDLPSATILADALDAAADLI